MSGGIEDEPTAALESKAEEGDVDAMRALGYRAREADRPEAARWWRTAADLGDPKSMYNLWLLLDDEEPGEARRWLKAGAEHEDRASMGIFGDSLKHKNDKDAERWWRRAATAYLEGPPATPAEVIPMYNLAVTYSDHDRATAIRLFEAVVDAADRAGDEETVRDALHNLAPLLLDSDHERARACLTRAAEMGDTDAMVRLGTWTVNTEPNESLRWFERAETLGDPNGISMASWLRGQLAGEGKAGQLSAFLNPFQALQRVLHRRRK